MEAPLIVTVIGKVNAGKSLLCNRLLRRDVAAVAPVAGWTKEVSLYPLAEGVMLADTPGIGDVDEAVASRAFDFVGSTDLFLHVVNADEGLTASVSEAHRRLTESGQPVILACNKSDHLGEADRIAVADQLKRELQVDRVVVTSAVHGDGVEELARRIYEALESRGDELRFRRFVKVRLPELEAKEAASEAEADSAINWATGRAAAIAISPIPVADVYPLVANQVYMVKKIGDAYGLALGESAIKGMLTSMGASFAGLLAASFLPGFKIPIAAGITFAAGRAAKTWCAGGGGTDHRELQEEYEREKAGYRHK